MRERCHKNFWAFAKEILDEEAAFSVSPSFTAEEAHRYFSDVYSSSSHQFERQSWMPVPPLPASDMVMDMSPVSAEELRKVISKSNSTSAPSPLDRISYKILKQCPSIQPALLDLFNQVIMEGHVPLAWKSAEVNPKTSC